MRIGRLFGSMIALIAMLMTTANVSAAHAADIIDEWANVKLPPAPELKSVTVDPKTTALLMLDFLQQNCGHRPSCLAEMPAMKKLLDATRGAGATIIYSGFGKVHPYSRALSHCIPNPLH